MKKNRFLNGIGLILIGSMISLASLNAFGAQRSMTPEEVEGQKYFEGKNGFANGGPSCISCHSVTNSQVAKGGLLAKDLTDVYTRMGEGILADWLKAPAFPAMAASYQNHPLKKNERKSLESFLKYVNDVKGNQVADKGYDMMLMSGGAGLLGILLLINIIWFKRKKKMVKKEIFERQASAWDAKH